MFNDITSETIAIKLSELLSGDGGHICQKNNPLIIAGTRICAYLKNDCSLCLSLEYGNNPPLISRAVMKYHWGWQLVKDHEEVIDTWLEQVHNLEAPDV